MLVVLNVWHIVGIQKPYTTITIVRLRMMLLLYNNRPYGECKGKRRHNLCPHGTCISVEGSKSYMALIENCPSDKSPWTLPIPYCFLGSLQQLCLKNGSMSFSRSLHCPSGFLRGKPGLCSPKAKAEMPGHQWSIRPNYISDRGGFNNRSQPT